MHQFTPLVCGSVAFDTVISSAGRFTDQITTEQLQRGRIGISTLSPEMSTEDGGCASNIAYNLALLGVRSRVMATVGSRDGELVRKRIEDNGSDVTHVLSVEGMHTAQAFILSDEDNNQVTAFHPGAMDSSHLTSIADVALPISLAILSPDGKRGTIKHAEECQALNIPFIFDPGQSLSQFRKEELTRIISQASYLFLNEQEADQLCAIMGQTIIEIAHRVIAVVITQGDKGSVIHFREGKRATDAVPELVIPVVPVENPVEPTGCGDAYRAGFMYGLMSGHTLRACGHIGSLMGAIKVESRGAQTHKPTKKYIEDRFFEVFNYYI